jgi:hypothetical protein
MVSSDQHLIMDTMRAKRQTHAGANEQFAA